MEIERRKSSKFCFVLRGSPNSVLCFAEALFLQQYATTLPEFFINKTQNLNTSNENYFETNIL